MPAITSSVSASVVRAVDGYVFVSTTSQWKNHSPMPVHLATQKVQVDIYTVKTLAKPGFIEIPDALGEPEFSMYPLKNYGTIDLEPGTDSAFTAYAALPPGGVYVVRWTILQKANEDPYSWDSEALLDLSAVDGT